MSFFENTAEKRQKEQSLKNEGARAEKTRIRDLVLSSVPSIEARQVQIANQLGYDKLDMFRQMSRDKIADPLKRTLFDNLVDSLSAMSSMLQVVDCHVDMREPYGGYRLIPGDITKSRREWANSTDGLEENYDGVYVVVKVLIIDDTSGEVIRRGEIKRVNNDEEINAFRRGILNRTKRI